MSNRSNHRMKECTPLRSHLAPKWLRKPCKLRIRKLRSMGRVSPQRGSSEESISRSKLRGLGFLFFKMARSWGLWNLGQTVKMERSDLIYHPQTSSRLFKDKNLVFNNPYHLIKLPKTQARSEDLLLNFQIIIRNLSHAWHLPSNREESTTMSWLILKQLLTLNKITAITQIKSMRKATPWLKDRKSPDLTSQSSPRSSHQWLLSPRCWIK